MSSPLDSTAWLSTGLMFALVGAGVLQTSPRNAGRPPTAEPIAHSPLYSERISARLWEDPLEAASRAQGKPSEDPDKKNSQKWLAAPKAFIQQTQLNYRTRKLTAFALRQYWLCSGSDLLKDARRTQAVRALEKRDAINSRSPDALKRDLARLALCELEKREIDSNSHPRSKVKQIFKEALATQRDTGTGLHLASSTRNHEQNSAIAESELIIDNYGEGADQPLREIAVGSNGADSANYRPGTSEEEQEQASVDAHDKDALQKLQSVVRATIAELVQEEASEFKSPQQPQLTLQKILEIPERKTLLLPIVVPEQMYPEVREERLRIRYAVVSALAAANFNPESADELNLVPVPVCTDFRGNEFGRVSTSQEGQEQIDRSWIPVPYEIFRSPKARAEPDSSGASITAPTSEYWQVVVFWIDARITKRPSLYRKNIDAILNTLCPVDLRHVHFISTQGSETLTEILASENALGSSSEQNFYFPFATVPKQWLIERVKELMANPGLPAEKEPIIRMAPVKRVQASDDYVIEMLLDELSLRLPSFGRKDGEVCLFYETDSFYGRSMVDVFDRSYRNFTDRSDARVDSIPYLKGVDGTLPTAQEQSPTQLDLQDPTALVRAISNRVMQGNSGQWVLDQRQTDYLERQAHLLKSSRSSQNKIKAIGVFGTSVFDKIKVIEILRKEFKDVWFFTVDLDASLINNNNPLATRNVLVGSALDFSVQIPGLKSPVFRDSYQSAAFLSTLDALGLLRRDYVGKPGVWETSRSGFEPLEFSGHPKWKVDSMCKEEASGNGPEKGQAWGWDTFLETHFQAPDGRKLAKFLRPVLLILTAMFLVAVAKVVVEAWRSPTKAGWRREIVNQFQKVLPVGSYRRVLAGMCAAVSALCLFGWLAQKVLGGLSEPFHWFDGVSVWPSLLIRGFATALGFYFFMRSFIDTDDAIHKMWASEKGGVLLKGLEAAGFPRTKIESHYYSTLLIVVASYVLVYWALIQMLGVAGGYFTPARGGVSFFAHEITLLFSMAVFYLLVWSAVLRHLRCRELLNKLGEQTHAPEESQPEGRSSLPHGALSKPEIDALLAYNHAVVQSILYPFAMLVGLLASRHPVFDAWNFPASLLISSSLILGVLIFCAYLLNESANKLAEDQKKLFKPPMDSKSSSEEIWGSKELIGSFIPFWKQPVIQALTLAAAGLGLQWIQ